MKFPAFQRQPAIEKNLLGPDDFLLFMRYFMQHPAGLLILAFVVLMFATGAMRTSIPDLGPLLSALLVGCLTLCYIYGTPRLAARFVRFGMVRNIPFAWCYIAFFMIFTVIEPTLYAIVQFAGHTLVDLPGRLLGRFALVSVGHVPLVLYHEPAIRRSLGKAPELVPVVMPVNIAMHDVLPAAIIEAGLDGRLLSLRGANQYTVVDTDLGEHLVRGTLKEMIGKVPDDAGIRLHRSWWVSHDEMRSATFDSGAKSVTTLRGNTYPVGQTRLADVKTLLG